MEVTTSTLGVMDTPAMQNEYMTVVSAIDCAVRNRGDWLAAATSWFKPNWFTDPHMRGLYTTIVKMMADGDFVTATELAAKLPVDGTLFQTRTAEMYGLIQDSASQGGNLVYYAKRVYEAFRVRAASEDLVEASEDIIASEDADGVLDDVSHFREKYAAMDVERSSRGDTEISEILREIEGNAEATKTVSFGFGSLDRIASISPGDLVVFTAPTSGGKSVMLCQIALNCANDGKVALVFSYEQTPKELKMRMAANLCGYPMPLKERGIMVNDPNWDRKRFIGGLSRVERMSTKDNRKLEMFSGGSRTVEQLSAEARSYCAVSEVGVIVVDYCQLVNTSDPGVNREQAVSHIVNSLKRLAMDTSVPVVTASQINEDGKTRESRGIANAANVMIAISPEGDTQSSVAKVTFYVNKNRDGGCGSATAFWDKPTFTFRDSDEYDYIELQKKRQKECKDYNVSKVSNLNGSELP